MQQSVGGDVDAKYQTKRDNESPGSAEAGDGVRDAFPKRRFLLDHLVCVSVGTDAHQLLGAVKLPPQHGQHVHACVRLALQQHGNILPVDFDALALIERRSAGLVGSLLEHGSKAEKLAGAGLVNYDFLMILIHRGHANPAADQYVSAAPGIADLPDALPWSECFDFDLPGQNGSLIVVEKSKKGNSPQYIGTACHESPRRRSKR